MKQRLVTDSVDKRSKHITCSTRFKSLISFSQSSLRLPVNALASVLGSLRAM